jgi:hypothetical protein
MTLKMWSIPVTREQKGRTMPSDDAKNVGDFGHSRRKRTYLPFLKMSAIPVTREQKGRRSLHYFLYLAWEAGLCRHCPWFVPPCLPKFDDPQNVGDFSSKNNVLGDAYRSWRRRSTASQHYSSAINRSLIDFHTGTCETYS